MKKLITLSPSTGNIIQDPKVNTSSKVINDWRNWKF